MKLAFIDREVTGPVAPRGTRGSIWAENSRFRSADFRDLRLTSVTFGAGQTFTIFEDCVFDGSRLKFHPGGRSRYVNCSFSDVEIQDWFPTEIILEGCTFSGSIRHSVFDLTEGAGESSITGNDFSGALLEDVAFRGGVDLEAQQLPSSPDYLYLPHADHTFRSAWREVSSWSDLVARQQAIAFLRTWMMDIDAGQTQLLINRRMKSFQSPGIVSCIALLELLR